MPKRSDIDIRHSSGLDRREFLTGTALLGAMAGLGMLPGAARAEETPKSGGTLKLGMSGGATGDVIDPRTFTDWVPVNIGYQIMSGFVEIDDNNQAVPELFESWEAKPGAAEWIFNIRKGVTFHNGKTLDADDVIYSINLHRGETKSAAKAVLEGISDVKKLTANQIQISLSGGNADLPYLLSDYHLFAVPNNFTDFSKPMGTGGYEIEVFEPGIRCITKKAGNYWKQGRAHVDSIELTCINDTTARTSALISGAVHVINRLDGRTVDLLKRKPNVQIIRSQAGQHATLLMNCELDPYKSKDVRLALKYAIDRQKVIDTVLHGYGTLGNDHPIAKTNPFHNDELPQHAYDPDKAKFHLKAAGLTDLKVELKVAEAAFTGATDTAVLFREAAAGAGIDLTVTRASSDGYWNDVWMKAPFCASYWGGRPTADQMLSIAYQSTAKWNETSWKRPDFDKLLIEARASLDTAKRKEMYGEMQKMIWEDGGAIIPMFIDYIEGGSDKVKGMKPHPMFDLMGQRIGERVWFDA